MRIEAISRKELALELELVAENDELSRRGIALLLRQPIARWGLSPRHAVLRFVRDQLKAAGLIRDGSVPIIGDVLGQLVALGECQEVFVGYERYIVPCAPCWISTGKKTGALLSVYPVPEGVTILEPKSQEDVVRRLRITEEDDITNLHIAGVRTSTLEEWIRPLRYIHYGQRRLRRPIRNDTFSLNVFWEHLIQSLNQEGTKLGEDSELRILSGSPGTFFGRYNSVNCEGRWSPENEDGIWCGFRRGYGENHWHPIVVEIEGHERRVIDLYDEDEWRWTLLARGLNMGTNELIDQKDASVKLSFPAPSQLITAMDLLGPRSKAWAWAMSSDAPNIWSIIFQR